MLHRLPEALRRALLAWTLVAFAIAQTLGAMHAVVHAPRLANPGALPHLVDASTTPGGWVAHLFAHHQNADHACDLYDQLSHADLLPSVAMIAPPVLPPATVPAVHVAWHLASQATGFLARGPPSFSS